MTSSLREGWRTTKFEALLDSQVLQVGDGYRAKNSELGGDGPIFLRSGHVEETHINFSGVERFLEDRVPHVQAKLAKPGDVIVTTKGWSTGRVAYVAEWMPAFVYSPHLSYWRSLDHSVLWPPFLRQWSRSPECQRQIDTIKMAIDIHPYLSLVTQRRLQITIPPLHEQRRIAAVLGALDDKIELNRQMNKTLEEMAQAIFKSWFIDFDGNTDFVDSELGRIPRGWQVTALGDHVSLQRGTTYSGNLVGLPGPALLGLGSIEPGGGFRDGHYKTYGGECPEKLMLVPGDLYVALKGATKDGSMVGSVARVPPSVPSGRLTQDTVKLQLENTVHGLGRYLYWLLRTPEYRTYCAGRITGCAQVGLSRSDFLGYPVFLPPDELLAKFACIEGLLADRGDSCSAQSATLAELRDTLLPKLISGEVRVPEAEKLVEAVA